MRDIIRPTPAPGPDDPAPALGSRLAWFALLTVGGVGGTAVVAFGLRWLLGV